MSIEHVAPSMQSLTSAEICFTMLKPDAIELNICEEIWRKVGTMGLRAFALRQQQLTARDVCTIWPIITHPHTSRTVPYLTSAPVHLGLVSGEDASNKMLDLKRQFRQQFPNDNPVVSVLHTTDHDAELQRCVEYFYGELPRAV